MATVHILTPCRLHGACVLPVRKPFRPSVVSIRAPPACHGRRKAASHQLTVAAAAQQSRQAASSQLVRTAPAPQDMFVLPRSQLANKQVVTRTKGFILGVVDHLIADPQTFKVVALSFKKSNDLLAGEEPKQISLLSLRQIADVLLVHDERALLQEPLAKSMGYLKIVGLPVKTSDGKVMGKVRDFEFSPDDGRITSVIIDKLGIPALPVRLFACYKIQAQNIANITWNNITLRPGSEVYSEQITRGLFDSVSNLIPSKLPQLGDSTTDVTQYRDDPEYVRWYVQNGLAHEAHTGEILAKPSPEAMQMYNQYNRGARNTAPQALPPARQPDYASQLQPQLQYDSAQLQYDSPRVAEPVAAWAPQQQGQMQSGYPPPQQQNPPEWSQPQPRQQANPQQQANGVPEQRSPAQMQFQQSQPGPQQQPAQGQQWLGQSQAPPKPREDWATNQAPMRQSGAAANKLEQQRRMASRAEGAVTEPRFDPRRRTAGAAQPALSLPAQGPEYGDRSSLSQRPSVPQTRSSYSPQSSGLQQTSSSGQYQPQPTAGSGYGSGYVSGSQDGRISPQGMPNQPAEPPSYAQGSSAQGQQQDRRQGLSNNSQGQQQGTAGNNSGNGNGSGAFQSGSQNAQQPSNSNWAQASYRTSNQPDNVTADR